MTTPQDLYGAFSRGASLAISNKAAWHGKSLELKIEEFIAICLRVRGKSQNETALTRIANERLVDIFNALLSAVRNGELAFNEAVSANKISISFYLEDLLDALNPTRVLEGDKLVGFIEANFATTSEIKQEPQPVKVNVHAFDVDPDGDQSKQPGQAIMFE